MKIKTLKLEPEFVNCCTALYVIIKTFYIVYFLVKGISTLILIVSKISVTASENDRILIAHNDIFFLFSNSHLIKKKAQHATGKLETTSVQPIKPVVSVP